jgi:hypothetical protein
VISWFQVFVLRVFALKASGFNPGAYQVISWFQSLLSNFQLVLRYGRAGIHHAPIDTLEAVGGGSVRCTMAELFV